MRRNIVLLQEFLFADHRANTAACAKQRPRDHIHSGSLLSSQELLKLPFPASILRGGCSWRFDCDAPAPATQSKAIATGLGGGTRSPRYGGTPGRLGRRRPQGRCIHLKFQFPPVDDLLRHPDDEPSIGDIMIKENHDSAGPCAARSVKARGRCRVHPPGETAQRIEGYAPGNS